jgi:hypothetical protein
VPRASSRFATLAQAINSTKPTAPSNSHSDAFVVLLRKLFFSGSTLEPQPVFDFGNALARPAETACMLALACASVTPGFKRPITSSQWKSWFT